MSEDNSSDDEGAGLRSEVGELRDALRAARRRLDAGERRERALRRALRRADELPGLPDPEDEPRRGPSALPTRLPIGKGGLLDQALLQSGMLATEEGRREVAEFLARATANVEPPGSRPPLPSVAPSVLPSVAHARPSVAPHAPPPPGGAAEPPPLPSAPLPPAPPPAPPPPAPPAVSEAEVAAAVERLLEETVAAEATGAVKMAVRATVASLLPSAKRSAKEHAEASGPYGQIYKGLLTDVLAAEAAGVVDESIEVVAADYVMRRGAERTFHAMVEEILRDELSLLAADARVEVVYEQMLADAMAPLVREVASSTLHEARGAAARRREADERQQVATRAAEGLFERLCLQRFLQHIATSGEVLLLQRQAAQLLDELVGEGLARKALGVGQEHYQLQSSAVLGAAHQHIAYTALVDEFLAQLRVLSSSGLEAGVPPPALETDTGSDSDGPEGVS